jgi:hypothetical protein
MDLYTSAPSSAPRQPHRRRKPNVAFGTKSATSRGRSNTSKRIVKYLSVCRDTKAYNAAVKAAPDGVIKTICNAALNVQRGGNIVLSKAQRALFAQHRGDIAKLVSKQASIKSKRNLIGQRGGAFWIPALIGAAISGLGSVLFGNKSSGS